MDRATTKFQLCSDLWEKRLDDTASDVVKSKYLGDLLKPAQDFLFEIDYFTSLLMQKEIQNKEVVRYYACLVLFEEFQKTS